MEEAKVICSIKGTSHQGSKKPLFQLQTKTILTLIKEKVIRGKMHNYKITAMNTQEKYPE